VFARSYSLGRLEKKGHNDRAVWKKHLTDSNPNSQIRKRANDKFDPRVESEVCAALDAFGRRGALLSHRGRCPKSVRKELECIDFAYPAAMAHGSGKIPLYSVLRAVMGAVQLDVALFGQLWRYR
jgi:hypothetical protein